MPMIRFTAGFLLGLFGGAFALALFLGSPRRTSITVTGSEGRTHVLTIPSPQGPPT